MWAPVIAALSALTTAAEAVAATVIAVVVVVEGLDMILGTIRKIGGGSKH
ncbi:hypothetical protein LZ012_11375 [Dechloromonas sp. XY25]|uniref:Uncharacterized protein n=1 Tax=Dechloromonas hankyongensis TaxID=2908002 RepID=A0ABS9K358_9RHOO|nr:hypothetical protein [Dechloromonas hankyongensis]MCG2577593.1 hypothetical protein [Dechloromonas hankyongensis]